MSKKNFNRFYPELPERPQDTPCTERTPVPSYPPRATRIVWARAGVCVAETNHGTWCVGHRIRQGDAVSCAQYDSKQAAISAAERKA